ncbi:hypothetical protein NADFUDRAFT_68638 [Nadsonia fulvescens var. elongata DSM 6958]|uniref:Developmental regulatory protein wetA n=1 Tax=Nadsonia fulvescens var. elongata DSM 6958 TaxID=857566 RepID=A0A1E3PSL2_9ASCO|nr:hypothetical protein NADFUDRAFT_68638 [Nadsonia fulvescens var. elongata DSM 6958]
MYQPIAISALDQPIIRDSSATLMNENNLPYHNTNPILYHPYILNPHHSPNGDLPESTPGGNKVENTKFCSISSDHVNGAVISKSPPNNKCLNVSEPGTNSVITSGINTSGIVDPLTLEYNTGPLVLTSSDVPGSQQLISLTATPHSSTMPLITPHHELLTLYFTQHPSSGLYSSYRYSNPIINDEPAQRAASTGSIFLMSNNASLQYSTSDMRNSSLEVSEVAPHILDKSGLKHKPCTYSFQVSNDQHDAPSVQSIILSPPPTASANEHFIPTENYIPGSYFESVRVRDQACDESISPLTSSISIPSQAVINQQSSEAHYTFNTTPPIPITIPMPTPVINNVEVAGLKQEPHIMESTLTINNIPQHLPLPTEQAQHYVPVLSTHLNYSQQLAYWQGQPALPEPVVVEKAENDNNSEIKSKHGGFYKNNDISVDSSISVASSDVDEKIGTVSDSGSNYEIKNESDRKNRRISFSNDISRVTESNKRSFQDMSDASDASMFVNFTQMDAGTLMSGVAPSGSMKTKARREAEAKKRRQEKRGKLASVAAAAAVSALNASNQVDRAFNRHPSCNP